MTKLGVAVIGTGQWGKNHARIYNELSSTELVAVCDVNMQRAKAMAELYGAKAYSDSAEMLRDKSIEAVNVCTWSTILFQEALNALNAGKHVLVEKPLAATLQQAEQLVKTAKANGLHLTVGFLMRFIPGLQQIREAVENKQIGELVCATAKRVSQWPERIGDVGVVKDTAIHDIDVMNFIFNQQPLSVYANMGSMKIQKFEDYAQIMLTYEGGRTAFIEANWLTPYKTRSLTVTGSDAIMRLDYMTQDFWIEQKTETIQPRLSFQEPLRAELQHFVSCITEKKTPLVTGEDGVKALKVAAAAIESSAQNRAVSII
ncbi:MAG: Gfo/Idh/MocA family oxidoreductase [Nitrososphaerota archaeon]|jgi:UDP-N-acetylglucosamine 3-dehydrogenase|nr:Gfo/Idh/MocA family oxidoreductase [Nitrososphaerota archaeon]